MRREDLLIVEADDCDIVWDLEKFPYPIKSGTADEVYLMAVLEHIFYPEAALEEAFRILKPGGKIIIEMPFIFRYHRSPNDYWRWTREGGIPS